MRKIKLPPNNKHKGLYVYCGKCKTYFSWTQRRGKNDGGTRPNLEPSCKVNSKKLSSCKFKDKHSYKSRIYINGGKIPKSKSLKADNYNEAVEEAIINAMVAAETMEGINGNKAYALPHDLLIKTLKKYNRLKE